MVKASVFFNNLELTILLPMNLNYINRHLFSSRFSTLNVSNVCRQLVLKLYAPIWSITCYVQEMAMSFRKTARSQTRMLNNSAKFLKSRTRDILLYNSIILLLRFYSM